ncbi:hypothetical protein HJA82_29605 [Rhizobium bangladeshense]|uniref:hypothetical protein n=1 Tax=Rhizobium bangladeshense TaxID=1138189 RepID=UPI001C836E73|nr:hypothetical protein [Rhizobium bangladeshense]MBX4911473.1 hypothetical protein [Rhizobium bangladeshense]
MTETKVVKKQIKPGGHFAAGPVIVDLVDGATALVRRTDIYPRQRFWISVDSLIDVEEETPPVWQLNDYRGNQWWLWELRKHLNGETSLDTRRAAGIALDFAKLVFAERGKPKIHIGMRIAPFPLSRWQRKQLLRAQIREHLRIDRRLRLKGYLTRTPEDPTILGVNTKRMIREFMAVIDNAHTVEVAGIHANGHHLGLQPVSECYVRGGSGWSGMEFYGQLLWRATIDGNEVVVLQPTSTVNYTFSEQGIIKAGVAP